MKKKILRILALVMAMLFVLTGCGAKSEAAYDTAASSDMAVMEEAPAEAAPMAEEYWVEEDVMVEEEAVEAETTAEGGTTQAEEVKDTGRKLIKRYYLSLETREYDDLVTYIQDAVDATGGYIESSSLSGTSIDGYGSRYAYFVLRIPTTGASSFLKGIEEAAHVTHKSEEVEDVTLAYVDTESRIEALRIEQETLMEMLEQADTLDTILGIQSRLTEVRYQLESYESQIHSYDNLIEYTTISVDVSEVVRETSINDGSFGERLKDNFADGFYDFGQGVQDFIIWFVGAIPTLLVLAVVAVVVMVVVKKVRKGRRGKKELEAVLKNSANDLDSQEKDK